ncbi:MAG: type VI secretion system tip protein TssI/VgrG [Polyangiales bacterium]
MATAAVTWMEAAESPHVRYAFHGHGDTSASWEVARVSMQSRVSEPYRVELSLTSSEHDDPAKLIGQACTLVIRREEHARCVHGIVTQIAHDGADRGNDRLRVVVMPALEALRHRVDSRIFQDKTVPEVVESVLASGLAPYLRKHESRLRRTDYPRHEYIVQYRESDLAFVERLLAEEGIWYRFEHSGGVSEGDCELLTLLDQNDAAPEAALGPTGKELPLALEHERDQHTRLAHGLIVDRRLGSERVEVEAPNWTHPEVRERGQAGRGDGPSRYEPYDVTLWEYQGESYARSDASDQARLRWEQLHARAEQLRGHSNLDELAVGMRVVVASKSSDLDGEWVITSLAESGSDTQQGTQGNRIDYTNQFAAQRYESALRPTRRTRSRVSGVALAHVVGADGKPSHEPGADDIHTDLHGRVRVKMTWDRSEPGSPDATTTCWLRVAQSWSGAGWGSSFVPRIGMEVVVAFVDGDPDRPLVTGCVYNGLAKAPHRDHKTRSYIRTQSSPGGQGYNELLFDDARDQELVSLRAQRDHREHVLRNQTLEIGGVRAECVRGDEQAEVHGERCHTVHGAETLRVVDGSTRMLELSGDQATSIGRDREIVVMRENRELFLGGRKSVVKTRDSLEVADGAHKLDHVSGQYDVIADEHFSVRQGEGQLYMKDAFYVTAQGSVQLKNAGFHLRADADGNTTLEVGKKLSIRVGNAQIVLSADGVVTVSGEREAKVVAGKSALALKPASAELKATKLDVGGGTEVTVKAARIALN